VLKGFIMEDVAWVGAAAKERVAKDNASEAAAASHGTTPPCRTRYTAIPGRGSMTWVTILRGRCMVRREREREVGGVLERDDGMQKQGESKGRRDWGRIRRKCEGDEEGRGGEEGRRVGEGRRVEEVMSEKCRSNTEGGGRDRSTSIIIATAFEAAATGRVAAVDIVVDVDVAGAATAIVIVIAAAAAIVAAATAAATAASAALGAPAAADLLRAINVCPTILLLHNVASRLSFAPAAISAKTQACWSNSILCRIVIARLAACLFFPLFMCCLFAAASFFRLLFFSPVLYLLTPLLGS